MNLYFLLEDSKSFFKVLPVWLNFILPQFSQITSFDNFHNNTNCFMIESGFGYPSIKNYFENSLCTIIENDIPLNYFIVCWDTDANETEEITTKKAFEEIFSRYKAKCELKLFVMNRCFETWLLGNCPVYYSSCKNEKFLPFAKFYNIGEHDPENMNAPENKNISHYHLTYLQEMLRYSYLKKNYSKGSPLAVSTKEYYNELYSRINKTEDLKTFRAFVDFLQSIR
ncbi:MAG: hypothetical protein IJG33_17160 [Selenomonadaceae bacterium]|nr:hypothetical protein [Selenomonadaceae bacterium]